MGGIIGRSLSNPDQEKKQDFIPKIAEAKRTGDPTPVAHVCNPS
jgi:hypothetical protein